MVFFGDLFEFFDYFNKWKEEKFGGSLRNQRDYWRTRSV